MIKYLYYTLSIIILISCQSNKGLSDSSESDLNVIINDVYKHKDQVVFILENKSDSSLFILEPSRFNIQRLLDTTWVDIRINHCPCGAPCAPPRYIEMKPFQQFDLNWDQKESWCKGGNAPGNDEVAYVPRGSYRFVFHLGTSTEREQTEKETIFAPFKVL